MERILDTRLKIESWDEKPYRESPDGSRFTRSEVVLGGPAGDRGGDASGGAGGDGLTSGTFEGLMYYRPDGTSWYVTLMRLTGTLDGRTGAFVLHGQGTFDGTTARGESRIVPGSGTGDLAGIGGTAESASTHADYPYMPLTLRYVIE